MLILPEVADEHNWYGGFEHMFTDNAAQDSADLRRLFRPARPLQSEIHQARRDQSFKDLLDPKWKGKIAMVDPRGGATAVSMAIVYQKFGPEFLDELLVKQQPVIVTNPRQMIDWFISGKYPIAMGIPNSSIQQFAQSGVTFDMGEISGLDIWSVGVCGIQVLEPRPTPMPPLSSSIGCSPRMCRRGSWRR